MLYSLKMVAAAAGCCYPIFADYTRASILAVVAPLRVAPPGQPKARSIPENRFGAATRLLWLLWVAWVPGHAAQAQAMITASVPPLAFATMFQQYPQAQQITWRRFQDWYQASYTQGQTRRLVRFNSNGDVEATGQEMGLSALSLPIKHTLATYYPTRTFCRAIEVTNAQTGGLTYEIATCETAISRTITLTADGRKIPRPE